MKVIPENILKRMTPEDRASLGKAGRTWDECLALGTAKNEKELMWQIVNLLRLRGIEVLVHRTDKKSNATIGWPDLTFAYYGKACGWEIKLPEGRLSPEQERMIEALASPRNGWSVAVIRSVDQAISEFHRIATSK